MWEYIALGITVFVVHDIIVVAVLWFIAARWDRYTETKQQERQTFYDGVYRKVQ